jgi:hypothetical protein
LYEDVEEVCCEACSIQSEYIVFLAAVNLQCNLTCCC